MPTPIDILLGPVSLGVLAIHADLVLWEAIAPAGKLSTIKGWIPRAFASFTVFFFLSSFLPMIWDNYLAPYQLFDLSHLGPVAGAAVGLLVYNSLQCPWHRAIHRSNGLWRSFHQMHHSAERVDTFGAFYFSPPDMLGWTVIGSLSMVLIVGVSPQAATLFLLVGMFLAIFQHANVKTPRWLGVLIQRPESHSLHHARGLRRYNYTNLPVFDVLFGTFRNPKDYETESGFYEGASARVAHMLLFKDVSTPENDAGEPLGAGKAAC